MAPTPAISTASPKPEQAELLPLFAVTIRAPGTPTWKVYVRSPCAEDAKTVLSSRGHDVVEAHPVDKVEPRPAVPRGMCLCCGYSLVRLRPTAAAEVQCPECGVINPALGENTGRRELMDRRVRKFRVVGWAIAVGGIVLGVLLHVAGVI